MRVNDAIIGLLLIAISVAVGIATLSFPEFPGQRYGPSLFPRVLAAGLTICGAILVVRGWHARAEQHWLVLDFWTKEPWRLASFGLVIAAVLLYILASDTVGFIPVAIVVLGVLFLWLGTRPITATITAVVATFAIHWFFATMLRVPLPRGWLNTIL